MKNFTHRFCKLPLICFILLFPGLAAAQISGNPVTDAHALSGAIKLANKDSILVIVNANSPVPYPNYAAMMAGIDKNVADFLKLPAINTLTDNKTVTTLALTAPATPQGGGLSPTDGIDALASFIAERFKQEIEMAFLDSLKSKLNKINELKALLPTTLTVLNQNDPYQYTTFFEALKEAFNKDLNAMPDNIGHYLATDPYKIGSKKPFYFPSVIVYQNLLQIIQGKPAAAVLDTLDNEALVKQPGAVNSYFRLLSVLSRTLTNPSSPNDWLAPGKIAANLKTPQDFISFFGLLLIKENTALNNITFTGTPLYSLITNSAIFNDIKNRGNTAAIAGPQLAGISQLAAWLVNVGQTYSALSSSYASINQLIRAGKPVTGAQVADAANTLIKTIDTAIAALPYKQLGISLQADLQTIVSQAPAMLNNVSALVNIAGNVKDKDYGLAITNAITALSTYLNSDTTHVSPATIAFVNKYGNFAVSIIKAQSSAEMEEALSSAALPVGSYRIKRNSYQNFSLNAYAGLFGGYEQFSSSVPKGVNSGALSGGFTAPVGLAFSWGSLGKDKVTGKDVLTGCSNSIFLSAIDVGVVTAFRLTSDATSTLPTLTWQNVIAPAAFYVHGFNKSPLSLGVGVQYGPELRSITNDSAVILPPSWSIRVFLAIDIPVFSFYTKTE